MRINMAKIAGAKMEKSLHEEHRHDLDSEDAEGMTWWNSLTPQQRRHWLDRAGSARPADAWRAYQHEGEA